MTIPRHRDTHENACSTSPGCLVSAIRLGYTGASNTIPTSCWPDWDLGRTGAQTGVWSWPCVPTCIQHHATTFVHGIAVRPAHPLAPTAAAVRSRGASHDSPNGYKGRGTKAALCLGSGREASLGNVRPATPHALESTARAWMRVRSLWQPTPATSVDNSDAGTGAEK